jgi:hypothetical protein
MSHHLVDIRLPHPLLWIIDRRSRLFPLRVINHQPFGPASDDNIGFRHEAFRVGWLPMLVKLSQAAEPAALQMDAILGARQRVLKLRPTYSSDSVFISNSNENPVPAPVVVALKRSPRRSLASVNMRPHRSFFDRGRSGSTAAP